MSIDGEWNVTLNSPRGPQQSKLSLKSDGSALTGANAGVQGSNEIKDGKIDGDKFSFNIQVTQPMALTISYSGEVSDDTLKGDVKFGSFGGGTFTATRT